MTETPWTNYTPFLRSVTSMTGEHLPMAHPIMRRRNEAGKWEYRVMTPEEEAEFVSGEAW